MSRRTVQSEYQPGELVLCFEPDPSKVKVLYDAKVLDIFPPRDRSGNKRPEYYVHFQGWNSSWDRKVPDSFILKNSDENRELMRKLASVAKKVKRNRTRKQKIDQILKKHFKTKPIYEDMEESEEDDDEDDESSDGEEDDDEDDDKTSEEEDEDSDDEVSFKGSKRNAEETSEEEEEEEEEDLEPTVIELQLPLTLKRILEDDCYYINRKSKRVQLPAKLNVIDLLEGYVKNFAVNKLCATIEKPQRSKYCKDKLPERNIPLCKEVVDGIRVCFDFMLPKMLLYEAEREQYEDLMANFKYQGSPKKSSPSCLKEEPSEPMIHSPRLRSADRTTKHDTPHSAPKIPRIKQEPMSDEEFTPRRMTRHAYAEEIKRSSHKDSSDSDTKYVNGDTNSKSHESHSRGGKSQESSTRGSKSQESRETQSRGGRKRSPPPPISVSSKESVSSHTSIPNSPLPFDSYRSKEAEVQEVFKWRLVPEQVMKESPHMPSIVYGSHHLLRLFVSLSDVLSQMLIPEVPLKHLLKHLEMFIDYLSVNREELFPENVYEDMD